MPGEEAICDCCAMLTDLGDDDDVDEKGNSLAGTARYTTSLCGCCSDFQSTCDSCCCPWCAMARQYEAVAGRENSFNTLLCLLNWCCGCTYFVNCYVRVKLNWKHRLNEPRCWACLLAGCCPACAMCQQHRELTARGFWPGKTIMGKAPEFATAMGVAGQKRYKQTPQRTTATSGTSVTRARVGGGMIHQPSLPGEPQLTQAEAISFNKTPAMMALPLEVQMNIRSVANGDGKMMSSELLVELRKKTGLGTPHMGAMSLPPLSNRRQGESATAQQHQQQPLGLAAVQRATVAPSTDLEDDLL